MPNRHPHLSRQDILSFSRIWCEMKPDLKSALFALSQHESTILALCLGTKILNGDPCSGVLKMLAWMDRIWNDSGPKDYLLNKQFMFCYKIELSSNFGSMLLYQNYK